MDFTDRDLAVGQSTVGAFWRWAFSSLADNALRGVFAEFLAGLALDVLQTPRINWDSADLLFNGRLVEVKSSADNQVWTQTRTSTISFDVAKKTSWDATTNEYSALPGRPAHVYVFCHYRGAATATEVVEIDRWDFYVLATRTIDEQLGEQKSLGLGRLRQLVDPVPHGDLRTAVEASLDPPAATSGAE